MIEHELPEGWEIKQLKELCDLFNGAAFKSTDYVETVTDTLLIRMGNIRPNAKFDPLYKVTFLPNEYATQFANYILRDGDLIIAMTDMATETKILGIPTAVHVPKGKTLLLNQRVGKLIIKTPNELDYRYIQLYLTSTYANNHYKNLGKGGVQINLGKSDILSVSVILPKISQQKQIVAKIEQLFGELDDGINILQTLKQQVKVFRQSVLKAAFSGKLTGSYASDDELPANWYIDKIANILEVHIGSTPSRKCPEFWNGDINWVSSGEVAFNKILDTKEKITNIALEKSSCKLHPKGTVLIGMIGEGKTRGQVAILGVEASHNQNSAAIRIDNSIYLSETLFYYLVLKYEENRSIGSGNNQKALNKSRVGEIAIPVIPIEEQKQIVTKIEELFAICDELDQTIDDALNQSQLLRQSILKQAFSGKLIQDTF